MPFDPQKYREQASKPPMPPFAKPGPASPHAPAVGGPPQAPGPAAARPKEPHWLDALQGRPVTVGLRDGAVLEGTLVRVYQYDLVLRERDGNEVLLFKHAILWVRPDKGRAP